LRGRRNDSQGRHNRARYSYSDFAVHREERAIVKSAWYLN
jgi:hypothetical protein